MSGRRRVRHNKPSCFTVLFLKGLAERQAWWAPSSRNYLISDFFFFSPSSSFVFTLIQTCSRGEQRLCDVDAERWLKSGMAPCRSGLVASPWAFMSDEDGAEALHRHAASWSRKPGTRLNSAAGGETECGSLLTRERHMASLARRSASSPALSEAAFPCAFSCIFPPPLRSVCSSARLLFYRRNNATQL